MFPTFWVNQLYQYTYMYVGSRFKLNEFITKINVEYNNISLNSSQNQFLKSNNILV